MLDRALDFVQKHLLISLLLVAGFRLLFLVENGLDLLGDESYYWDWSRHPDWCYYSKPPMVAWLIGGFTYVLGDSAWVVRLPAVLLGTVFLYYFHAITRLYYGPRQAALAVLLILATPINLVANFLMTIDPPLYCFWIISLYYLSCALFKGNASAWLKAGLATAAALLSKQVAIAVPLMAFIFILITPGYRQWLPVFLRDYLLPVLLVVAVIVYWNSQHQWVMFGHSQGHFSEPSNNDWLKHLQHARDFWFYQLLLLTPPVFVLVLITASTMAISFTQLPPQQRFLWMMGPGLLLAILMFSFARKMQGNWPMPFYFTALIVVVGRWSSREWPRLWKWMLSLGFAMVLITTFLPVFLGLFKLQKTQWDPTSRFKSWQPIATQIDTLRQTVNPDLKNTFLLTLGHRSIASQLAFYLPDHPSVFRYEPTGMIVSQYEVWGGPIGRIGQNAFIIAEVSESKLPQPIIGAFETLALLGQVSDPNRPNAVFYVYYAKKLIKWPEFTHQEGKLTDYE